MHIRERNIAGISLTVLASFIATLLVWAQPSRAAAQYPDSVVFSIGTSRVWLDAQYIKPPQRPGQVQTVVPMPFNCANITNYDGADWYASKGQTSNSGWFTFECTHYDRVITLNFRGNGSYDEVGFADMWFDFKLAFAPNGSTFYSNCAQRTVEGPSDPGHIRRWEVLDTNLAGRCGDWQISARISMQQGFGTPR